MKTARLYSCARCHHQVLICSNCDRGNIYCNGECAKMARLILHRQSNQNYQKTSAGKIKHAKRQQRYRQRQKAKVTDRGSTMTPVRAVLVVPQKYKELPPTGLSCCHFCGKAIPNTLRTEPLSRHFVWILGTRVVKKE